jgi:hypothetical protein
MINISRRLVLAFVFCALAGWPALAHAQAQAVRVDPKPLGASDPQAQRAAVLVKQLLAGDKPAALKTLRTEGEESFAKRSDLEQIVDAQIARLGKAKYTISSFETGLGADVVVLLDAKGAESTNIVVRFNDAKKIVGFAQVQIDRG